MAADERPEAPVHREYAAIAAARRRSERVDQLVQRLAARLETVCGPATLIALGAYGRRELTAGADADLLFLHAGDVSPQCVLETVCYPLWHANVRLEPLIRSLDECLAEAQRSWSLATNFLDARFVAGDRAMFELCVRDITRPIQRDSERLRRKLQNEVLHRYAHHPSAATSTTPDIVAGRGGLQDLVWLQWLGVPESDDLLAARDALLGLLSAAEELTGHTPHRLTARLQERLAAVTGEPAGASGLLARVAGHARRVAFELEGVLAAERADRVLGHWLVVRGGRLSGQRMPSLEHTPSLGWRVANLVGLAAPDRELLEWASQPGPPLSWDEASLKQFLAFLRAADWRAWEFLDVTGLLVRYIPELQQVRRRADPMMAPDEALDAHSFSALRRLHEWTDTDAPFAQRLWSAIPRRDVVYSAVLLHELEPQAAAEAIQRVGLAHGSAASVAFAVATYRMLIETATRRDVRDPDLAFDLAARLGSLERLSLVCLMGVAHELASGAVVWGGWRADQLQQLFARVAAALRQPDELGVRRARLLEQRRQRIVRELHARQLGPLASLVAGLPRRYVLSHSAAAIARHLALLAPGPLGPGEVRLQGYRQRQRGIWEVQLVARDRPGLLATMAGAFALRGISVLAADAATSADGLVLDVFTVAAAPAAALGAQDWPALAADVRAALDGRLPLHDLLGRPPAPTSGQVPVHVSVDNTASQFFSVVEVRAADQVGLLYRIADGLYRLGVDIHHAKVATLPDGALDAFYVWDTAGNKLTAPLAAHVATTLTAYLQPAD